MNTEASDWQGVRHLRKDRKVTSYDVAIGCKRCNTAPVRSLVHFSCSFIVSRSVSMTLQRLLLMRGTG